MGEWRAASWLAVVCLLMAVGALAYSAGKTTGDVSEVIRAERIELVDSGKVTAILGASPDGLVVRDASGKMMALVGARIDGVPQLGLFDEHGRASFSVYLQRDGASGLYLSGQNSKSKISLSVSPDGTPALYLRGENGRLAVYYEDGTVVWSAPEGAITPCAAPR